MLGKIVYIGDNTAHIQIDKNAGIHENLMNLHIRNRIMY